ncbi:MAG TPA: ABC transporter permease, partial [Chloroflexota bacterium]|nr:ABC transporter permease [Chloroflexota bacterium]
MTSSPQSDSAAEVMVVEPSRGWRAFDLRELWRYRELVYFLAWRDVKVRYKQTAFGVGWVLLQPLIAMAIFSFFFGRLAHMPSDGLPYPLFAYTGLLPWMFFATATTNASNSLVANTNLVSKVYFPRLVIPIASVSASVVDLSLQLGMLVVLLLVFGVMPGPALT